MVYKSHPGEFINSGLFIKFKGLLCGNPIEGGESLILNFWPRGSLYVQPRHRDCRPQASGFRTGKNTIHQIFTLSTFSRLFEVFRDFFLTFWDPGAGGPGRLFLDSFWISGLEGPRDSCRSSEGSQSAVYHWIPNHYLINSENNILSAPKLLLK